mmetsp:Transcript_80070/g.141737  ORF Transcript_80070/g.141737 Transcript_80070/m.141737 type:complete len:653 (-) Transcript_80070:398-2356(-)
MSITTGAGMSKSNSFCQNSSSMAHRPRSRPGSAARSRLATTGATVASAAALPDATGLSMPALLDTEVKSQLQQMGFSPSSIRSAAQKLGRRRPSITGLLQELLSASSQPPPESSVTLTEPLSSRPASGASPVEAVRGSVSEELEQLGISPNAAAATVARLSPGENITDALNKLCLEPDYPLDGPHAFWDCQICFETQRTHGWQCPEGHRFCATCMRGTASAVAFPRCPQVKCSFELQAADLKLLKLSRKRLEAFERNQLSSAIESLGFGGSGRKSADRVVHCQRESCSNVMLVEQGQGRQRFACPCGAPPFCTECGDAPYHFHGTCMQVSGLRRKWVDWVSKRRERGRMRSEALAALHHRCQTDRNLRDDELWKAEHCRLCPKCNRVVEKLDGCNSMKCGQDCHGGNNQQGCGTTFNWAEAQQYTPLFQRSFKERNTFKVSPEEASKGKGLFHPGVNCKVCKKGIFGPRFRCIHCESFDVCIDCEAQLDNHDLSHVFEIIYKSDFDWSKVLLPPGVPVRIVPSGSSSAPKWCGNQFEGRIGDIVEVVEGAPVSRGRHSSSRSYHVKIRGHRGSNPQLPAEYVLPLFRTPWEAECLLTGRYGEPEPESFDIGESDFLAMVKKEGALAACRELKKREVMHKMSRTAAEELWKVV